MPSLAFAATFTFSRPDAAPVRAADGSLVLAPPGVPRFDHAVDGIALGMLVEPGAQLGKADRCHARPGIWEIAGAATVLHEYIDPSAGLVRRALYTTTCRHTVDALLASAGHHRRIGVLPTYLFNHGGYVRYGEVEWTLPAAIAVDDAGRVLADDVGRIIIDG